MKISFLIAITLGVLLVYFIIWHITPTYFDEIAFSVQLVFIAVGWLVWGIEKISTGRLRKLYVRFNWYHKMGLTESACFVEPGYTVKVWRHLFVRIPK